MIAKFARAARRALVLALVASLGGCRGSGDDPGTDPSAEAGRVSQGPPGSSRSAAAASASKAPALAPPRPLNVILILVDSMRWDMPWAGYPRDITPRLSELEKSSVSYSRGYSVSSTTARSVAALLASDYPSAMVRNGYFFTRWYPENLFLAEILAEKQSHSFGAHAHAYFFPQSGLNQGVTDHQLLSGTFLKNTSEKNVTSERLVELAKTQITTAREAARKSGAPYFGYVHFMDPHSPYVPHKSATFGSKPRDLYDAEIKHTDRFVGELIDWLDGSGAKQDTAIIVSADHGECFGEHGHLKHGYELWEELIRVPLLIRIPDGNARRIAEPRSHIDLAPTILELMGYPAAKHMRGKSLVPELRGAKAKRRVVVADLTRDNLQDRRRAVIDGDLKLLVAGDDKAFWLFNVAEDPYERRDLVADKAEFERMKRLYFQESARIPNTEIRGDLVPLRNAPEGRRW